MKQPSTDDLAVGRMIAARRRALGMSQNDLAQPIGVSWRQVQKYEDGDTRIPVGRLIAMARVLRCSAAELLEPIDNVPDRRSVEEAVRRTETLGAAELVDAWRQLSPLAQRSLLRLLHALLAKEQRA